MSKYLIYIFIPGLIIFSITCKKENDVITSADNINVLVNTVKYEVKNSYWTNMQFQYSQFTVNYNQYGFYYMLDSNSFIRISFGIAHKSTDYSPETECLKLKNEIFYEIFRTGDYGFIPSYTINDLTFYEPGVIIEYQTREKFYSSIKRIDYKCFINSENSCGIKQIEFVKKNLDWSDCKHSKRILRIEGSFECYVYSNDNENFQIDSLKLTCNDFIGTVQN
jgi:hypothetical protein